MENLCLNLEKRVTTAATYGSGVTYGRPGGIPRAARAPGVQGRSHRSMTQSVVVQGKLRQKGEGLVGTEPRGLVFSLMSILFSFHHSRPVRKPDWLLLLGPGVEGARRGQPGAGPALQEPLSCH